MNPTPVILEGDAVRIVPLDQAYAEELFAAAADPVIWPFMPIPQPTTLARVQAWIDEAWKHAATGDQVPFALIDISTGRAVGSTRYLDIRRNDKALEIGWTWLGASARRTSINTEAKYLLLRHAFQSLGAIRVQFKVDERNLPSQRAVERLGAVKEGVLRKQRINHDGFIRNAVYYSILDDEWPAVRKRLETLMRRGAGPEH
jgi:RimJ/RimL family protein N-acetyltransferase